MECPWQIVFLFLGLKLVSPIQAVEWMFQFSLDVKMIA